MLIPSIDLQGGAVVQLVQGERLAIRDDDVFRWVRRFATFPEGAGHRSRRRDGHGRQPRARPRRSPDSCRAASAAASAPSSARGTCSPPARSRSSSGRRSSRTASPTSSSPKELSDAVGAERVIAAVDSRGGHVVIHGWKTRAAADAGRCRPRARAVLRRVPLHPRRHRRPDGRHQPRRRFSPSAARPRRRVTAAGGITTQQEIDDLDAARRRRGRRHGHLHGKTRICVPSPAKSRRAELTDVSAVDPDRRQHFDAEREPHEPAAPVKARHATPPPASPPSSTVLALASVPALATADTEQRLADGQTRPRRHPAASTTFPGRSRSPDRTGRT